MSKPDVSSLSSAARAYWLGRSVVCLCKNGNSRSVGMAYILKDCLGANAVALGVRANSADIVSRLCEWASVVILMDARLRDRVPSEAEGKLLVCDVGSDTCFRGISERLASQCVVFLEGVGERRA